jgi:hypothetical protein
MIPKEITKPVSHEEEQSETNYWDLLPAEMILKIMSLLDEISFLQFRLTCREFHDPTYFNNYYKDKVEGEYPERYASLAKFTEPEKDVNWQLVYQAINRIITFNKNIIEVNEHEFTSKSERESEIDINLIWSPLIVTVVEIIDAAKDTKLSAENKVQEIAKFEKYAALLLKIDPDFDLNYYDDSYSSDNNNDNGLRIALRLAIENNLVSIVEHLIEHPKFVDAMQEMNHLNKPAIIRYSIIHAIQFNDMRILKMLLNCTIINVNETSPYTISTETTLHYAIELAYYNRNNTSNICLEIIELLLLHPEIKYDAKNNNNVTPLQLATGYKLTEIVYKLKMTVSQDKLDTYKENKSKKANGLADNSVFKDSTRQAKIAACTAFQLFLIDDTEYPLDPLHLPYLQKGSSLGKIVDDILKELKESFPEKSAAFEKLVASAARQEQNHFEI